MKESSEADVQIYATARWRVVGQFVSIVALAWVVWQLWGEWPSVIHIFASGSAWIFFVGFALTALSAYTSVGPFWVLVRRDGAAGAGFGVVAHLYFVSQLLKHLPGRVWGIGYQASRGRKWDSVYGWVGVNLIHMALATYVALALSAIVAISSYSLTAAAIAASGLLVAYALMLPMARAIPRRWRNTPRLRPIEDALQSLGRIGGDDWGRIGMVFLVGGIFQYLAWIAFGSATGLMLPLHAMQLCALYMLAWFIGWASLVTPSGLGVREAAFVWLAAGYDAEAVAAMAIIGRFSQLLADIFLGAVYMRR